MSIVSAAFTGEARKLDKMADILDILNRTAASPALAAEAKAYRTVADRLRKADRADGDELLGAVGLAAQLVDVSTTRVRQLLNRPDAPAPVADLAAGRIYLAADIHDFRDQWTRKPGRPRAPARNEGPA